MKNVKILALIGFLLTALLFTSSSFAQDCVTNRPTISITPKSLSGFAGETFNYEISIKSEDSRGCAAREYTVDIDASGLNFFVHEPSLFILPGETEKVLLDVNVPSNTLEKKITIRLTVFAGNDFSTDSTELIVLEQPKTCDVFVDSIDVFEEGFDVPDQNFCTVDTMKVKTAVSLVGDVSSEVDISLFVNNKLFDSRTINFAAQSSASFFFDRKIDASVLGLANAEIKVVAKADCDVEGDDLRETISIDDCRETECLFDTSIATPFDKAVGEEIVGNVLLKNKGIETNLIHYETSLCKSDGTDCERMVCGESANIQMRSDEKKNIFCNATATETGKYALKLETIACGEIDTVFTNSFDVLEEVGGVQVSGVCSEKLLNEYRCVEKIRQAAFQQKDCSKLWNDVEYCPFGCSGGECKEQPALAGVKVSAGRSEVLLEREYVIEICGVSQFNFDVKNSGAKDTFTLTAVGDAASWLQTDKTISLGKGETKTVTVFADVPCDAKSGNYPFTISAKSKTVQSSVSSSIFFVEQAATTAPSLLLVITTVVIGSAIIVLLIYVVARKILLK